MHICQKYVKFSSFTHFCREIKSVANLRALSGKFLREKSCYLESFCFFWLCIYIHSLDFLDKDLKSLNQKSLFWAWGGTHYLDVTQVITYFQQRQKEGRHLPCVLDGAKEELYQMNDSIEIWISNYGQQVGTLTSVGWPLSMVFRIHVSLLAEVKLIWVKHFGISRSCIRGCSWRPLTANAKPNVWTCWVVHRNLETAAAIFGCDKNGGGGGGGVCRESAHQKPCDRLSSVHQKLWPLPASGQFPLSRLSCCTSRCVSYPVVPSDNLIFSVYRVLSVPKHLPGC